MSEAEAPGVQLYKDKDNHQFEQVSSAKDTNDWYEIDAIRKRRKKASEDMFLVRRKGAGKLSLVYRQNLFPAALRQIFAEHGGSERRGHCLV